MSKGELTRAAILDVALETASKHGLEGLTIGVLAEQMQMSKSGVFAHFGSREDLQIETLKLYHQHFEQEVFYPSMIQARGLPRLRSMFQLWTALVTREIAAGCIYISGAIEYDDREGMIRNELVMMVKAWQNALRRATEQAIELGQLQKDTNPEQIVYEMYGLILALHHDARFLQKTGSVDRAEFGFNRMIGSYAP
ncbi:MAG: TetR/AcrR family transcriptional regulator [Undibacterium sp.]|nr:TetR/AcrR family transcriptional regulator [Undibacterium sp.]